MNLSVERRLKVVLGSAHVVKPILGKLNFIFFIFFIFVDQAVVYRYSWSYSNA